MISEVGKHTEWCIVRYVGGKRSRARYGYKSKARAERGIRFVAAADAAEGTIGALYAVGKYLVGEVRVVTGFCRCS